MISFNNKTDFLKNIDTKIQVDSPLCLLDAYDHDDILTIQAKKGDWQAQVGFFEYAESHKTHLINAWGARIAHALANIVGDDFDTLLNTISLLENGRDASNKAILEPDDFIANSVALLEAYNATDAGFDFSKSDQLIALKAAATIIRETSGFDIHDIQRDLINHVDAEQAKRVKQKYTDAEMLLLVQQHTKKSMEFENEFIGSVASKGIQFIRLKHADVVGFSPMNSNKWKQSNGLYTSSGRLGLLNQSCLSDNLVNITDHLEQLSIEYKSIHPSRNPSNFKKVGVSQFGLGAVTLHRDSNNDVYVIQSTEGEALEIFISFDKKYEDD